MGYVALEFSTGTRYMAIERFSEDEENIVWGRQQYMVDWEGGRFENSLDGCSTPTYNILKVNIVVAEEDFTKISR